MARTAAALFDVDSRAERATRRLRPAAQHAAAGPPSLERLIDGAYWRWLPVGGLWFLFAFLIAFGVTVSYVAQGRAVSVGWVLYATIPHFLAWALLSPVLYRATYEIVAGERRIVATAMLAAWSAVAIGSSTVFCFLGLALRDGARPTLEGLVSSLVAPPVGPAYQSMNVSILVCALAAIAFLIAVRQRARARWVAADADLRDSKTRALLAESRLLALQARINPHFLLNGLNTIAGFVQSGRRDDAFDTLARLGSLLRTALSHGDAPDVTLGEELAFAESYMQLLQTRFGPAFRYSLAVPEALRPTRLPALVVQPLIENAVRHGMRPGETLTVNVRAYAQGTGVVIEVADDGAGFAGGPAGALRAGHGLANVAERLRIVFGDHGRLEIDAREPRGALARLRIAA